MSDPTQIPVGTTGVPGIGAVPSNLGVNGAPQPEPKTEPQVPTWEPQIAELRGQLGATNQMLSEIMQRMSQPQTQEQPAQPQKTLTQLIADAKLPDPASVSPEDWEKEVAKYNETLASNFETYFGQRLESVLTPLQAQFQQQQAIAEQAQRQQAAIAEVRKVVPGLEKHSDWEINQALNEIFNPPRDIALSRLAERLNAQTPKPTGGVQPLANQSPGGPAAELPNGITHADIAQLRQVYNELKSNPFKQQEMMNQPDGSKTVTLAYSMAKQYGW